MSKRRRWEHYDDRYLSALYPHFPTKEIAEDLERSLSSVYQRARDLGLRKHPAYYLNEDAGRSNLNKGVGTRFEAGHKPWNKGKKGWRAGGRSAQTRFRPGNVPHTWKPIGTERITRDGIRQRKVTATGYPPRDWKPVHVLHWERYRGPVPAGCLVRFRNGDKTDIRMANLELVSRAENMRRNSFVRLPPALRSTIQQLTWLKRKIREAKEHGEEQS